MQQKQNSAYPMDGGVGIKPFRQCVCRFYKKKLTIFVHKTAELQDAGTQLETTFGRSHFASIHVYLTASSGNKAVSCMRRYAMNHSSSMLSPTRVVPCR